MSEIFIDKDDPEMELDPDELALLEEVEIDPRPARSRRGRNSHHPVVNRQEVETMDAFMNPDKTTAPPPQREHVEEPIDYHENDDYGEDVFVRGAPPPEMHNSVGAAPSQGFSSLDDEKADILNKLARLSQKKGINVNKRLSMYSEIDELRSELKRARYSIDVEQSVKFSRRALIACITGLEFLNKRYDPFDLKLEGWSESIMENIDDYDEPFEELYVKYKSDAKVPPEIKLIMMIGGSGMMFHLTNSMFKSVMPNVNDIMKQNPGLAQNMMSAVQNTMQSRAGGAPPVDDSGGRREMNGPGFDLGSLMGNLATPMPPQPVNTYSGDVNENAEQLLPDDDISDIVSVVSHSEEVRDVSVKSSGTKRRGRKKKVEATI
jgi:hypothetical protein